MSDLNLQIPLKDLMDDMGRRAKAASGAVRRASAETRSLAISLAAKEMRAHADDILAANAEDLAAARAAGQTEALLDRLKLDPSRLEAIATALDEIAAAPDPVGKVLDRWTRPNGLDMSKVTTPIGVLAIIYEARPNVTADAAALCLRSGNVALLRSGGEALSSALAIHQCFQRALVSVGLTADAVQLVPVKDRDAVGHILSGLDGAIHLIIPRGGKSLVARVKAEARAPVLGHLEGLNHVFVHQAARLETALSVVTNAKMRRVSVCGAAETLLIDRAAAEAFLPPLAKALTDLGCTLRGDDAARAIVPMEVASREDYSTEYLAPILSVAVVDGVEGAISHVEIYGSGHTEAIITEDAAIAEQFLSEVDSSIVLVNASTQFADGGEFGFGAEIGISTDRLHARGPVGAAQLVTFKYQVRGNGQVRP